MHCSTRLARTLATLALLGCAAGAAAQQAPLPAGYVRPGPAEPGNAPQMRVTQATVTQRTFDLRFGEGDEILSGITELAARERITAGYLTGIGGLARATLGWGDPAVGGIKTIPVEQKAELASLTGNITLRDGRPYVHAHAVVALTDGSTKAGHVVTAHVAPLAEVTVVATAIAQ
jgi:hypothetical protein